jgi:hypothetical protein
MVTPIRVMIGVLIGNGRSLAPMMAGMTRVAAGDHSHVAGLAQDSSPMNQMSSRSRAMTSLAMTTTMPVRNTVRQRQTH